MPDEAKGSHRTGFDNLIPAKPGEVRNPAGNNQWTALRQKASDLFTKQAQQRIRDGDEATISKLEAWLDHVWDDAIEGESPHLDKLIAERVLPAIQHIELSTPEQRKSPSIPDTTERLDEVSALLGGKVGAIDVEVVESEPDALH